MKRKKQPLAGHLTFRATENDVQGIEQTADNLGVSVSDAIRILVRRGLATAPAHFVDAA